jgi:hypothetical protein
MAKGLLDPITYQYTKRTIVLVLVYTLIASIAL